MAIAYGGVKRRIECMEPVEAIIGKLTKKSNITGVTRYGRTSAYIGYQRATGPANRFQCKTESKVSNSAAAEETRQKFATALTNARSALADPTQRATLQKQFQAQTVYRTLQGFAMQYYYKRLE